MPNADSPEEQEKVWLGLLLAWIAGGVDAAGFLVLLGVFTTHMTGNSTSSSIDLSQAHWQDLLRKAFPIPVFVLGVVLGAALTEAGIRRREPRILSLVLGIDAILLLACLAYGDTLIRAGRLQVHDGWRYYLLLALPALAMGMQNVSVRRAGGRAIHTTYITGALTNAAESAVLLTFWLGDRVRGRGADRRAGAALPPAFGHLVFYAAIWASYALGAICAALLEQRWQLNALALPLAGLAAAIAWSLARPIYTSPQSVLAEGAEQRRLRESE